MADSIVSFWPILDLHMYEFIWDGLLALGSNLRGCDDSSSVSTDWS